VEHLLLLAVQFGCLALQLWAVIDCVTRRSQTFVVAEKLTKPAWLAITIVAAALVGYLGVISFIGVAGIVASIVYLVDVRPAVKEITNGESRW
jgi:pseudouridine-5'-phosphate glycosidase